MVAARAGLVVAVHGSIQGLVRRLYTWKHVHMYIYLCTEYMYVGIFAPPIGSCMDQSSRVIQPGTGTCHEYRASLGATPDPPPPDGASLPRVQ